MTDPAERQVPWAAGPRAGTPGDDASSGPDFVAPSQPSFAPAAGARAGSSAWPTAGAVPFTAARAGQDREARAAVVLAVVGVLLGLAIGWGLPLSIVGAALGLRARRRGASRTVSRWTVVLAIVSGLASLAWFTYSLVVILA